MKNCALSLENAVFSRNGLFTRFVRGEKMLKLSLGTKCAVFKYRIEVFYQKFSSSKPIRNKF